VLVIHTDALCREIEVEAMERRGAARHISVA
jgi:hypothetical protein